MGILCFKQGSHSSHAWEFLLILIRKSTKVISFCIFFALLILDVLSLLLGTFSEVGYFFRSVSVFFIIVLSYRFHLFLFGLV